MIKSIIVFFIALAALLPLASRSQTTVVYEGQNPSALQLKIERIEWDTLDVLILYTDDGRGHELICGFNPWYGESRSRLEYKNNFKARIAQFHMDDFSCLHLFNFSKAAFEGVSKEHPVTLDIDIKNGKLTKITLPALDFYERDEPETTEQTTQLP